MAAGDAPIVTFNRRDLLAVTNPWPTVLPGSFEFLVIAKK
jgi:hypothetical protein